MLDHGFGPLPVWHALRIASARGSGVAMFILRKFVPSPFPRRLAVKSCRIRQLSLLAAVGMALLILEPFHAAQAASRLKDLVDFEGVRDNMLVGYGLVVGLNG